MKLKEAFEILVQATGSVIANRETHFKIQQALDVIREIMENKNKSV